MNLDIFFEKKIIIKMTNQAYKSWDIEQDKYLIELYCNKIDLKNIADDFGRSYNAIELRLKNLCFNYYKDDIINKKEEIIDKYYSKKKRKIYK